MSEFFEMGGYAAYVWSAYAITLIVILLNVWTARRARAHKLEEVRRVAQPEQAGRQPTVRQLQ